MRKIYICFLILIGLHFFILMKLQFTAWPEMFSFPYMVNHGFLIYKDFHHAYQPLLTIILSFVYKTFGYKLLTLEIFTWLVILASDLLIFLISFKMLGKKLSSLIPMIIFITLQPFFEGNMLWFDLATLPFILASIYFLFDKKYFWSGIFIALAILVKQQIVIFLIGYFIYFWIKKINLRRFVKFTVGGLIPVTATLVIFFVNGALMDYFFWTLIFPLKYLPTIPGYAIFPTTKQVLTLAFMISPLLLISKKADRTSENIFLGILLVAAILSSLPRFSYFHLQPMIGIYSIFISGFVLPKGRLFLLLIPFAIFLYIFKQNVMLLNLPPRFYDAALQEFSDLVDQNVSKGQKLYLLGPNSLVYVLAGRIPAKPWIENYVWHFEVPGMQEKMLAGWKLDPPDVVVWSDSKPGNWFDIGTYEPREITDWIRKNYIRSKELETGIWLWRLQK